MKRFLFLIILILFSVGASQSTSITDSDLVIEAETPPTLIQTSVNNILTGKATTIVYLSSNLPIDDEDKNNSKNVESMKGMLDQYGGDINYLSEGITDFERKIYSGLATVTALTSLHPNPRSEGIIELALGLGAYRDHCAGAVGLFIHPTDWSMIQGGFAMSGHNSYAGYIGITISLSKFIKKY